MIREVLVGSTGFVGSNLLQAHDFDGCYHSSNIKDAYGVKPELLVYAGVPSEMFTANQNPAQDAARIEQAKENIEQIEPEMVVLISTVAVYDDTKLVNENSKTDITKMPAYGRNRYELECWVEENYSKHLIVRLPAIYGAHLKKNFIYDYIHRIPALLKYDKFLELSSKEPLLLDCYIDRGDGFYSCKEELSKSEEQSLKNAFIKLGFTALNFTDSRSVYQFYPLRRLWSDIMLAKAHGVQKLNLVTPPVSVADVYKMLEGREFYNELSRDPYDYDIRTVHSNFFFRDDGYIMNLEEELEEIKRFVETNKEEH